MDEHNTITPDEIPSDTREETEARAFFTDENAILPERAQNLQNPKYNPESPEFDRAAYADLLMKEHTEAMLDPECATWRVEPYDPKLDIFNPEFDVNAYIDQHLDQLASLERLRKVFSKIAEDFRGESITFFSEPQDTPAEKTKSPRALAIAQGAIMNTNRRLTYPSEEELENAFNALSISALPTLNEGTYSFDDDGQLCLFPNQKFEDALHIHGAFLAAVFTLVWISDDDDESICFYVPDFCQANHIDPRPTSGQRNASKTLDDLRIEALYKKIEAFERFVGHINGGYYRILTLDSYDKTSKTMTVRSPYLFRLRDILKGSSNQLKHSPVNRLLYSSVTSEPNLAAVEVAKFVLDRLLRRGAPGEAPVYKITLRYSRIVSMCPTFQKELADIEKADNKKNKTQLYNNKIKRIFETAFRIILEESEAPYRYQDLKINGVSSWEDTKHTANGRRRPADFKIPTKSKLASNLVITHKGYVHAIPANMGT